MDEEHADAYYNLGVAYVFEENNEKALTLFKKATEIQPDHFFSWQWCSFVGARS